MKDKKDLWLNIDLATNRPETVLTNTEAIAEVVTQVNITKPETVPLYDPYTGEPNMEYEALTGRKNPLLRNEQEISHSFEPKKNNRFIVKFPTDFGIPEWATCSAEIPSLRIKEYKLFGYTFMVTKHWESVGLELFNPIDPSISEKIMAAVDAGPFNCLIKILDPTGQIIEIWRLDECVIEYVSGCFLSHTDDGISKINISIRPKNVTLN